MIARIELPLHRLIRQASPDARSQMFALVDPGYRIRVVGIWTENERHIVSYHPYVARDDGTATLAVPVSDDETALALVAASSFFHDPAVCLMIAAGGPAGLDTVLETVE